MIDFILADRNIAFAVVLGLLILFFLLELAGMLFGASLSNALGDLDLPDLDLDLDLDGGVDLGFATKFLYWLKVGKVPIIILLVIFMMAFVLSGYALQLVCLWVSGHMLPAVLASGVAVVLTIPFVRLVGGQIARIIPKDETEAVSRADLVGGKAVIVLGRAAKGSPAQARTHDRHGTTHYLMVEPDDPSIVLEQGIDLLLVREDGAKFYAIVHPDPNA